MTTNDKRRSFRNKTPALFCFTPSTKTFDNLAYPELVTDEVFQLIICALLLAKYGDAILNLERKTGDIKQ